jgi:hypothetical protein
VAYLDSERQSQSQILICDLSSSSRTPYGLDRSICHTVWKVVYVIRFLYTLKRLLRFCSRIRIRIYIAVALGLVPLVAATGVGYATVASATYGSISISNATILHYGTSLQLPAGSQVYLWGMDVGGAHNSTTFADGTVATVKDSLGMLAAQLGESTVNTNSYETATVFHTMGGVGVAGFSSKTFTFAANGASGTLSGSVTFTVRTPSVVIVIALQSGARPGDVATGGEPKEVLYNFSLHGIPGAQIDAAVGANQTVGIQPMIIAHSFLGIGTYTVTTSVSQASPSEAESDASLIGVWAFTSSTPVPEYPTYLFPLVAALTLTVLAAGYRRSPVHTSTKREN